MAGARSSADPSGHRSVASGLIAFPEGLKVVPDDGAFVTVGFDHPVHLTHIDTVYFPDVGYTKGDILGYYRSIAPVLLPHLAGRALTLHRFPGGLAGTSFYEKRCPGNAPDWIVRAPLAAESVDGTIDYCTATDVESLLWMVNLGCVEFHPQLARADRPDLPDFVVFDLDRHHGATWEQVVHVAGLLRSELEHLGMTAHAKTSGSTGLHVYVPIQRRYSFPRVKRFAEAVGNRIVVADPENVTASHRQTDQVSRVFLDHNQNGQGRTMASAYSVRPRPTATVSTPLRWEELGDVAPDDFTIATIWDRLREDGDLFAPTLEDPRRIEGAERTLGLQS